MEFAGLTPKQAATIRLARDSRIAVWEGAVRSGKTVTSLLAWVDFILNAPPGPLLMAGRTIDTLIRNVVDPLIDLVGTDQVKVVKGDGKATILGRKVHLVGADNMASESRIRGLTLAGAYVDELTILGGPSGQEWWSMLLTRMSVEGARVLGTTNPGPPTHWLLTDYLDQAALTVTQDGTVDRNVDAPPGLNLHRYRFTIDDNVTLPAEYVKAVKASLSGMFYKRFIDGLWVAAEGAVYPMLDMQAVQGTPPEHLTRHVIGIDHGTTNPTHAVLVCVEAVPGGLPVAWVTGECRLTDSSLTPVQQAEQVWAWAVGQGVPADVTVVLDPAAAGFRNSWHQVTGRWPWQADNAVTKGISVVSSLLGQDRLRFAQDAAPHVLRELSGYTWDPKAQQRGEDKPLKVNDHGPDALRYAVMAMRLT